MSFQLAAPLVTWLAFGGCRLPFWAGEHELEFPPRAEPTPTHSPDKT